MDRVITVVSGLPRTGTSMMMKMLAAGGMEAVVDNIRVADEDNLNGYFEFEPVKKIKEDQSWLDGAAGKVFKMVSMLLYDLPKDRRYKVIFMQRDMWEMLASQKKMLERKGQVSTVEVDEKNKALYEKHLEKVKDWLGRQNYMEVLYVNYNDVLREPHENAAAVNRFLGGGLDVEKMAKVFDKEMYRNRAGTAGPA